MPFDAEITEMSRDLIVLERARAIIAAGWAKGGSAESGVATYRENDHAHCAMNALCIAESETPYFSQDYERAAGLLGFSYWGAVWNWNDAPSRTKAEVLARFDAAIAKLGGAA